MPKASAPNAPCVEVWLSPQTMVVPGRVQPCSGPTMCTMPWRISSIGKYSMPNSRALFSSAAICSRDSGSVMPLCAVLGRAHCGRPPPSVSSGRRTLRPAVAQAFEGLRAGHFVHEMAVDIEHRRFARRLVHQMRVPDLVVKCPRRCHDSHLLSILALPYQPGRPVGKPRRCRRLMAAEIQHRHDDYDGHRLRKDSQAHQPVRPACRHVAALE